MVRALCIAVLWGSACLACVTGVVAWMTGVRGWLRFVADLAPAALGALLLIAVCTSRLRALSRTLSGVLLLGTVLWSAIVVPDLLRSILIWPFASAEQIKLVQFNIQLDDRGTREKLAWIVMQNPDFLTFQEVKDSRSQVVSDLQKSYPYIYTNVANSSPGQTIILSKTRAVKSGYVNEGPELAWATFVRNGKPVTVVSTHVSRAAGSNKVSQAAAVAGLVNGLADQGAVVLAGDFNDTPWTPTFRQFESWLNLRRRTFDLATWPALALQSNMKVSTAVFPIDHVFASSSWRTRSVFRGPFLGSDHYPLVVTLTR